MFDELSDEQRKALERIVSDWISEGFTTPPYEDAFYDIFEALGIAKDDPSGYDTRRPIVTDSEGRRVAVYGYPAETKDKAAPSHPPIGSHP